MRRRLRLMQKKRIRSRKKPEQTTEPNHIRRRGAEKENKEPEEAGTDD